MGKTHEVAANSNMVWANMPDHLFEIVHDELDSGLCHEDCTGDTALVSQRTQFGGSMLRINGGQGCFCPLEFLTRLYGSK